MMASLVKHQDAGGMWHQLIDQPESWPETSCSAMFTFAMISGVESGWLDRRTYRRLPEGLARSVIKCIDEDRDVRQVCEGTGKKTTGNTIWIAKRRDMGVYGRPHCSGARGRLLRYAGTALPADLEASQFDLPVCLPSLPNVILSAILPEPNASEAAFIRI